MPVGFRLPKASLKVSRTTVEDPDAMLLAEAAITLFAAEYTPGFTVMESEVMVNPPSVARKVWMPEVFKVVLKEPTPFVRVAGDGTVASGSEEVMVTTPL